MNGCFCHALARPIVLSHLEFTVIATRVHPLKTMPVAVVSWGVLRKSLLFKSLRLLFAAGKTLKFSYFGNCINFNVWYEFALVCLLRFAN